MSTQPSPVDPTQVPAQPDSVPAQPTLEQKIDLAAEEAAKVASLFNPAIGAAIAAGVQVEPIIAGLVGMFKSIFAHHVKQAVKS